MAWKYNLAVYGSCGDRERFIEELDRLGYQEYPNANPRGGEDYVCTKFSTLSGEGYDHFSGNSNCDAILYLPQDFNLAVALATMRDSRELYKGEIVFMESREGFCKVAVDGFGRYKIVDVSNTDLWWYVDELDNPCRKATKEEIISLYRSKSTEEATDGCSTTPARKIIGYKSPFDLFQGDIPAGNIYKPLSSRKPTTYAAVNSLGDIHDSGRTNLPAEIVEKWEPVYEEDSKVMVISGRHFEISSKGIYHKEQEEWIDITGLRTLAILTDMIIYGKGKGDSACSYKVAVESFKIGCTPFTMKQIKEALSIYDQFQKS